MRAPAEALGGPVGGERAELVADIEAHVVALLEHDELRWTACRACQPLALADRNELVAGTENDQQRASDPLCDAFESEAAGDVVGFGKRLGMATHAECLLRGRGHGGENRAEVERSAIGDASLDARLKGRGERRVERPE